MIGKVGWNWDKVSTKYWMEPSEDIYYLLHRWKAADRVTMLDLGCGLGRHAILFAAHGFKVTAADVSESGLRSLERLAKEKELSIDSVQTDITKLPFVDKSFDAVLAYHSIYHVDTAGMNTAMAELHRVLKPSAEAYLTFISKSNPTFRDQKNRKIDENVRMKREEDGGIRPHFYYDRADIDKILSGFQILKLRQIEDIFEDRTSWHYFALVQKA